MTHKTTAQPTAVELLHSAQNYRTSLESLMAIGKVMLAQPSLEDDAVNAYQVLAEGVLEEADHQGDLAVVEGVEEGQARVELIMQDVLTPRLTEVEDIEQALLEKAESQQPVPFTTRDVETAVSQEALFSAEVLGLYRENIGTVRQVLSMEGMNADLARPMVMSVVQRAKDSLRWLGVSMEALEETQVLGDMSEAVERIEALVTKAHEQALEHAEGVRNEAENLGSDGSDPMGDLIEKHRGENATGAVLDEETKVTTIEHEVDKSEPAETDAVVEGGEEASADLDLEGAADGEVSDTAGDETSTDVDVEDDTTIADVEIDAAESEVDAANSAADSEAEVNTDETQEEENTENDDDDDEEEETASTESLEPVVFESLATRTEDKDTVKDILNSLMSFLHTHDLLTEAGHDALLNGLGDEFVFDDSMVAPRAAEVLARHYHTWIAASVRDGEANVRAMGVLLGL